MSTRRALALVVATRWAAVAGFMLICLTLYGAGALGAYLTATKRAQRLGRQLALSAQGRRRAALDISTLKLNLALGSLFTDTPDKGYCLIRIPDDGRVPTDDGDVAIMCRGTYYFVESDGGVWTRPVE